MDPNQPDPPNKFTSKRLYLRAYRPGDSGLYFHLEGIQRLRHWKKCGELVDRLWFGLLRSEWQERGDC